MTASAEDKLRGMLHLIDEAEIISTAQLKNRCVYQNVDWEIGMNVGGSDGDNTPTPFVNLVFKAVDENGQIRTYPTTFSLNQFNDFVQNVQRMHKSISSFK